MRSRLCRVLAGTTCVSLLAVAQNEDKNAINQRISLIRDLGKKNSDAVPALAQYLSDPNREVRLEAVKAIVKVDGEKSLDPLAQAEHDNDPEIQIRATDGIVNYYVPGYVAKGGLTSPFTRGVRQVKSFFSARNDQVIDPDKEIRPGLGEALGYVIQGSKSMEARANAALAAGILRARASVPALLDALRSKNNDLIFESLVALQKIHDPSICRQMAFLTHDLDDRIQTTALETVGLLRALDCAQDVRSALVHARNEKVRRTALEALAMLGIPGDRSIFLQYLHDRDEPSRVSALEGLGRIREPEDNPALQEAYNETDAPWKIHLAAAFALVSEGNVETSDFSPLLYLFENLDVPSRADTAKAYLDELGRRDEVQAALFTLASKASKDQKIALCEVFSKSRSEDVIPTLEALRKDIDPDVAFAASRTLRIVKARTAP